jgi:hypothetical protein
MESTKRGEIYNRARAKQLINFNGLVYGTITPTDIDGLLDFHGKCFVFIEAKYKDTPLPNGQRRALETIVRALNKPAICIVATHSIEAHDDIDMANCLVREYFENGRWQTTKDIYRVKRMVDEFVGKYAPECLHLTDSRQVGFVGFNA